MTCDKCLGFGVWAVGMPVPMEEQHFNEGQPNKPCPKCGSGKRKKKALSLEEALTKNAMDKEKWLYVELVKGLEQVGVEVGVEEDQMNLAGVPFKTVLTIKNKDSGKIYKGGLRQELVMK